MLSPSSDRAIITRFTDRQGKKAKLRSGRRDDILGPKKTGVVAPVGGRPRRKALIWRMSRLEQFYCAEAASDASPRLSSWFVASHRLPQTLSRRQHRRPQTHTPHGLARLMDLGTSARPGAVCGAGILFDRGVADRGVHLSMTMNGGGAHARWFAQALTSWSPKHLFGQDYTEPPAYSWSRKSPRLVGEGTVPTRGGRVDAALAPTPLLDVRPLCWFVALAGTQQKALSPANAGAQRARGQPVPHCVPHRARQVLCCERRNAHRFFPLLDLRQACCLSRVGSYFVGGRWSCPMFNARPFAIKFARHELRIFVEMQLFSAVSLPSNHANSIIR
jgi:hypothetical protein